MEILLGIEGNENLSHDGIFENCINKDKIEKSLKCGNVCNAELVNIGPGADWVVLLVIVDIGLKILELGSIINNGIDGWIGIGKRLSKLFQHKSIVSIDITGATSLAIELIAREVNIVQLEKLQETSINIVDVSGMIPINKGLSARPHNYYIQTYKVNEMDVYVIGIMSNGEAHIIKHFVANQYGIWEKK